MAADIKNERVNLTLENEKQIQTYENYPIKDIPRNTTINYINVQANVHHLQVIVVRLTQSALNDNPNTMYVLSYRHEPNSNIEHVPITKEIHEKYNGNINDILHSIYFPIKTDKIKEEEEKDIVNNMLKDKTLQHELIVWVSPFVKAKFMNKIKKGGKRNMKSSRKNTYKKRTIKKQKNRKYTK